MIADFRYQKVRIDKTIVMQVVALNEYGDTLLFPSGEKEVYRTIEGVETAICFLRRLYVAPVIQEYTSDMNRVFGSVARLLTNALGVRVQRYQLEIVQFILTSQHRVLLIVRWGKVEQVDYVVVMAMKEDKLMFEFVGNKNECAIQ